MTDKDFNNHVWETIDVLNVQLRLVLTQQVALPIEPKYPDASYVKAIEERLKQQMIREMKEFVRLYEETL